MSPFLRGTLFGVGLAGAFVAGYLVKHSPRPAKAVAETPFASQKPPTSSTPTEKPAPVIVMPDSPPSNLALGPAPIIDFDKLPPPALKDTPVDPNDLAFQIIKKQLGIKTTVLEDSQPLPFPMTGPPPRLAPPPAIYPQPPFTPVKQVTSRAISLDFEMTRLGTGKVMAVELWTTRDGGATWGRTDRMDGCVSPFQTRLWSEGNYGFRLVFESESGVKTPTPKPGDLPELAIELVPLSHKSEPTLPEGKLIGVRAEDDGPEMGPMPRTVGRLSVHPSFPIRVPQGKTEARVLVLMASLKKLHPDVATVDHLLNAELVRKFDELMKLKGESVTPLPPALFEDYKDKHESWVSTHPYDIGRAIAAEVDYVIDVEIQEFVLGKPENRDRVFRGKTELVVNVYDLSKPNRDTTFRAELSVESSASEIEVESEQHLARLKAKFVEQISREVVKRLVTETGGVVGCTSNGLSSASSLMDLLRDNDWKPSTATPESYRTWQYERAKPSFFWGSYPGPAGIEFNW